MEERATLRWNPVGDALPARAMTSLTKSEFPDYQGGQNDALKLTALLWALAIAAVLASRFALGTSNPWIVAPVWATAFVLIGWCQASLSNGFHEAVHSNFGARHRDWLSLVLLGYPTFFTMQYRTVHLQHHLKAGDPTEDPDFETYGHFPRSRFEMLGRFVLMASGLAAAKQLVTKNLKSGDEAAGRKTSGESASKPPLRDLAGLAAVQLVILGGFVLAFGWKLGPLTYIGLWILPLGTIAKFVKSTRAFCEHGSPDREYVLRTITGKPWQTGTLGMYGFHYHAEHHLYPWVAYARLAKLHERLKPSLLENSATHQGQFELFHGGYFALLAAWFRDLPWRVPEQAHEAQSRAS